MMFNSHLLSLLIWLPIIGGFITLGLNDRVAMAKWLSLLVSGLTLALSVPLWTLFKTGTAAMQFVERAPWISTIHSEYFIGVDGISMPLILLTTFTTVLIVIASWSNVAQRVAQYFAAFLILEGLMIGVFAALDGVLFYVFWEAMLIPMFIIIGVWGGPRRVYATIKFFLYTFIGSLLMLVALIYMYLKSGSYELAVLQRMPLTLNEQTFIFLAFFAAFAVKVPMWPVHTWLPDAHVEAPTGGSVVLAAIMLKMGGYGFLRFSLPMAPDASRELDWLIIALSLIAVVYIGFVALAQRDMKKLIAYSSIAHMGFALMGLAAGGAEGVQAMLIYMVIYVTMNVGTFAFIMSMEKDGKPVTDIGSLNQFSKREPMKALAMLVLLFSLAGVPPMLGFFGKFYVLKAAVDGGMTWLALAGAIASVIGAFYYLRIVFYMYFGAEVDGAESRMVPVQWLALVAVSATMLLGIINFYGIEPAAIAAAKSLVG